MRKSQQSQEEATVAPFEELKLPVVENRFESPKESQTKINLLGFKTVLTKLPIFGNPLLEIEKDWPNEDHLKKLPISKKIKLS